MSLVVLNILKIMLNISRECSTMGEAMDLIYIRLGHPLARNVMSHLQRGAMHGLVRPKTT